MSLHLDERTDGSLALFIDGDLQFDTADEALYHESLSLPALCLARPPEGRDLRVLICGGGDGLALRECLRFPGVCRVDLVDYSPEVLDLGRTRFADLNAGAFADPRVTVAVADAWEFLADGRDGAYDVVLCDFTVPRRPEDARVFSREWYQRVSGVLAPNGVAALNAVSPQATPEAFWCLRRTVRASGLFALPYRVCIPSFRHQGYGAWGFLLAAHRPLRQSHLRGLSCPAPTRQADVAGLWRGACFSRRERALEASVPAHTLAEGCLVPLLLNPGRIQSEPGPDAAGAAEPFDLERLLGAIPLLHPYHTREMIETLAAEVAGTLRDLDIPRLVDALLERAAALPRELVGELNALREFVREHTPRLNMLGAWCYRLFAILLLILTVANTIAPDNAFGKGHAGLGHVSVSRGLSSFGGGRGVFGGGARAGSSFQGARTTGGSFGRQGAFGGGEYSATRVSSAGFRRAYTQGRAVDICGNSYQPRVFHYSPGYVHIHTGGMHHHHYAQQQQQQQQPAEAHKALFVADDDLMILDNGDAVVTLSDQAYLLAAEGRLTLFSHASKEPLLALYPEPNLFERIASEVQNQRAVVRREIAGRQDWLAWVGWTSALFPVVAEDRKETENLVDLGRRLEAAATRLGKPNAPANIPGVSADAVELFVGCFVLAGNRIAFREPSGKWATTDGTSLWNASGVGRPCPPPLKAALRSIMANLLRSLNADYTSFSNDLNTLASDRASLDRDLAEYRSIYAANGYQSSYQVDYGTESITVSDAISRTERDLQQNAQDTQIVRTDYNRVCWERSRVDAALSEFVVLKAIYGDLPNGRQVDVTRVVSGMGQGGKLRARCTNEVFGDPAPGVVKALRVDYVLKGQRGSKSARESEVLVLP